MLNHGTEIRDRRIATDTDTDLRSVSFSVTKDDRQTKIFLVRPPFLRPYHRHISKQESPGDDRHSPPRARSEQLSIHVIHPTSDHLVSFTPEDVGSQSRLLQQWRTDQSSLPRPLHPAPHPDRAEYVVVHAPGVPRRVDRAQEEEPGQVSHGRRAGYQCVLR